MAVENFDVIIVGGGPAGSSCALSLSDSRLKILLIEKAEFPRDKICGDALTLDVINQLPKLSEQLYRDFDLNATKLPTSGVRLFSPDLTCIDLPFIYSGEPKQGFVFAREHFDNLLFQHVKKLLNVQVRENCDARTITRSNDGIIVETNTGTYHGLMIVGADGANSVVDQLMEKRPIDRRHHSAGLRIYYEGVEGFNNQYIELYFFKNILPGYLWVFPMHGNKANVGIGVLSSKVSKQRINLRDILNQLITTHPVLEKKFRNARPLEKPKGHGLPLGSKKRKISGERFLLTGDAAGLIDPFTGEGIGNAIRSGRVAADHIINCFDRQNFSSRFNKSYDDEIYRRTWNELRTSRALQRLCCYPSLFNFIFHKASENKYWHNFLIQALSDVNQKKQFVNPLFYYRLFFGKN